MRKDIPTKDHQPSCLPERPAPSRWWFQRFCSGPQKQTFQQWSVDAAWCSQIGWSCDQLVGGCACYILLYLPLYIFDIVLWCFLLFHGESSFLYLLSHIHCKASCPRALHGSWDIWLQASVVPVTSKDVPVKPTHEPPPINQTQLERAATETNAAKQNDRFGHCRSHWVDTYKSKTHVKCSTWSFFFSFSISNVFEYIHREHHVFLYYQIWFSMEGSWIHRWTSGLPVSWIHHSDQSPSIASCPLKHWRPPRQEGERWSWKDIGDINENMLLVKGDL